MALCPIAISCCLRTHRRPITGVRTLDSALLKRVESRRMPMPHRSAPFCRRTPRGLPNDSAMRSIASPPGQAEWHETQVTSSFFLFMQSDRRSADRRYFGQRRDGGPHEKRNGTYFRVRVRRKLSAGDYRPHPLVCSPALDSRVHPDSTISCQDKRILKLARNEIEPRNYHDGGKVWTAIVASFDGSLAKTRIAACLRLSLVQAQNSNSITPRLSAGELMNLRRTAGAERHALFQLRAPAVAERMAEGSGNIPASSGESQGS